MQRSREISPRLTCAQVPAERPVPTLADDVRAGLLSLPRQLPPKYFYDELGSEIFEQICLTPEYYPSRTEEALLQAQAGRIIELARPDHIIELGSGSSRKTRHLFDACDARGHYCTYWPFDVAETMLLQSGAQLVEEYPWLTVRALTGDYNGGLACLPMPEEGRRLLVFLGGTIGNFNQRQAIGLLAELAALMGEDDLLLLGADRVKDSAVLEAAYDDAAGVTARFNLNLLNVLNRELDADFRIDAFEHLSVYVDALEQVEMRLRSKEDQSISLARIGEQLELKFGEEIRTEISRKFTLGSLQTLLQEAGMILQQHFEAPGGAYSLVLAGRRR